MERTSPVSATIAHGCPCPGGGSEVVGTFPGRRPMATRRGRNGDEAGRSALAALPDVGTRVLSASAVVAYVAVGAAAILSRSVAELAQDALTWVLPRDGEAQHKE